MIVCMTSMTSVCPLHPRILNSSIAKIEVFDVCSTARRLWIRIISPWVTAFELLDALREGIPVSQSVYGCEQNLSKFWLISQYMVSHLRSCSILNMCFYIQTLQIVTLPGLQDYECIKKKKNLMPISPHGISRFLLTRHIDSKNWNIILHNILRSGIYSTRVNFIYGRQSISFNFSTFGDHAIPKV